MQVNNCVRTLLHCSDETGERRAKTGIYLSFECTCKIRIGANAITLSVSLQCYHVGANCHSLRTAWVVGIHIQFYALLFLEEECIRFEIRKVQTHIVRE